MTKALCLLVPATLTALGADPGGGVLPLRNLVLYSSGVGWLERVGEVQGHANVELRFKTEDINDLLKSMIVQDLDGGTVSAVTYDSRDPIARTLKSFAIDLTSNPSMADLLNQMRGERVTVAWPGVASGTILGVEFREETVEPGPPARVQRRAYLNLLAGGNLQSIPLASISRIELANESLRQEFAQALEVLARGHDTQKKTVSLAFDGEGRRRVKVSYVVQTPVWKTSYRLVLDEENPFLQGWAIVENTSDEDWKDVRLSLVSGRPISFTMDLYEPLYASRPVVKPELNLSLRPQVYGDALEAKVELEVAQAGRASRLNARRLADMASVSAGSKLGFLAAPAAAPALAEAREEIVLSDSASAIGDNVGELFEYAIKSPVSIDRQKSAMLPIVAGKVAGEKLSIYNPSVHAKFPLNGFRLKNTTDLHLMQGPITVFDGGAYAGDARIEDLAPGQDRLISYALDLKTEVERRAEDRPEEFVAVTVKNGLLTAQRQLRQETTYNVRNRDTREKELLIEHPLRGDWKLDAPSQSEERTRDLYRFRLKAGADGSAKLVVKESQIAYESLAIVDLEDETYQFYLRSTKVSPAVKKVLERVVDYRRGLAEIQGERTRREQRIAEIGQEQSRIRENMGRLNSNSDLYRRYVQKFDEQETQLENLRQEIEGLKDREAKRQREMNDYLKDIDLS